VWRLLSCQFIFSDATSLPLGLVLIYMFRMFERHYGSKKFAGSLIFFSLCSTALQLCFLLGVQQVRFISPGPFWLIFGLFIQYFIDIPQTAHFRFLGLPFSEKTLVYFLGIQLMCSTLPDMASLVAAACGLLSGLLWRTVPLFSALRPPSCLARLCQRFLEPLFSSQSSQSQRNLSQDSQSHLQSQPRFNAAFYEPIPQNNPFPNTTAPTTNTTSTQSRGDF